MNKELESLDTLLAVFQQEIAGFSLARAADFKGQDHSIFGARASQSDSILRGSALGTPHTWLARNARMAILAFHSLEDRLIKRAFTDWERQGWVTRIGRKPLVASEAECGANPRSRSAKLRTVRIVGI